MDGHTAIQCQLLEFSVQVVPPYLPVMFGVLAISSYCYTIPILSTNPDYHFIQLLLASWDALALAIYLWRPSRDLNLG